MVIMYLCIIYLRHDIAIYCVEDHQSGVPSECVGQAENTFTFVREPLQRFISGFVESVHRTLNPINQDRVPNFNPLRDLYIDNLRKELQENTLPSLLHPNKRRLKQAADKKAAHNNNNNNNIKATGQKKKLVGDSLPLNVNASSNIRLVNTTIVAKYLDRLLSSDNRLILAGHFYPMAGIFFHMSIRRELVGQLEAFEQDWLRIMPLVSNQTYPPYNFGTGLHPTSVNFPYEKAAKKGTSCASIHPSFSLLMMRLEQLPLVLTLLVLITPKTPTMPGKHLRSSLS